MQRAIVARDAKGGRQVEEDYWGVAKSILLCFTRGCWSFREST